MLQSKASIPASSSVIRERAADKALFSFSPGILDRSDQHAAHGASVELSFPSIGTGQACGPVAIPGGTFS